MRVVVTGATGNVGTSVLRALGEDPEVESIVGVARRRPETRWPKVTWVAADVTEADLVSVFRGADAVIHLAWLIQPSRDVPVAERVNVWGSERVFSAVAEARVPALVYASSVGAYSPGPKDRRVDESWPTDGIRSSFYSRHKAAVERLLDAFERDRPEVRVVRLRPGLIFKREAASGIRRLFTGPLLPSPLVHPRLLPVVPDVARLRVQAVHGLDVGEAYRLAAMGDARGPFNVAAEPVLDPPELARILGARTLPVPARALRAAAGLSWRLRLQPTPPGWLDLGLGVPLMDMGRAREVLGWTPRHSAADALLELMAGLRERAGLHTPPLDPGAGGPLRVRELLTGVGRRSR
jgi:nucleoside-diphosphate-sugar epimerase